MKFIQTAMRCANVALSHQFQSRQIIRKFSAWSFSGVGDRQNANTTESADDFERRIFGGISESGPNLSSFYQKLDKAEKAGRSGLGSKSGVEWDGLDDSFNTLSDGLEGKLKKAATYFDYDPEEVSKDDYTYRPDMNFMAGANYDTKDLDLRKPGVWRPYRRSEFETTTEEVLRKADFRNVRFLANFITEAGIIIKRSKTGISAKAQRKVAREIKTARALGLMPFTTMGTKQFIFGKTMENLDEDYGYRTYDHNFVDGQEIQEPLEA